MSNRSRSKPVRPAREAVTTSSAPAPVSNRPPGTIGQLVTAHDVQLYRLTQAYHVLVERMNEYEKRQQESEVSVLSQPTFEEEAVSAEAPQLGVVVEES